MSLENFLRRFGRIAPSYNWYIRASYPGSLFNVLRCKIDLPLMEGWEYCPLEVMHLYDTGEWGWFFDAADKYGLTQGEMDAIMRAADGITNGALRDRMIKMCRIREPALVE